MKNETPLLSILIPTKNRYDTLLPVISAILLYVDSMDFEIIVQDNSDHNQFFINYINDNKDNRIKYFYNKSSISIVDNTIYAIENSKGKYLTFIGDDDLVSPYIYDIVKLIDKANIKCLSFNPAYYWWNTIDFVKEDYYNRKDALWLPKKHSSEIIEIDTKLGFEFMLKNGAVSYYKLPKFYHGIVKREVLETIKVKCGTYLPGMSPDIAFATSLALVLDKYHYMDYPVTVFGASKNSGGGMSAKNKHYGKIEDQSFLPRDIIERWNPNVPKIWSERSTYTQTVSDVLRAFNVKDEINYIAFYSAMLAYEFFLFRYIYPCIKAYCKRNIISYITLLVYYFKRKAGMLIRSVKKQNRNFDYKVEIAHNVNDCMILLKEEKLNFINNNVGGDL